MYAEACFETNSQPTKKLQTKTMSTGRHGPQLIPPDSFSTIYHSLCDVPYKNGHNRPSPFHLYKCLREYTDLTTALNLFCVCSHTERKGARLGENGVVAPFVRKRFFIQSDMLTAATLDLAVQTLQFSTDNIFVKCSFTQHISDKRFEFFVTECYVCSHSLSTEY